MSENPADSIFESEDQPIVHPAEVGLESGREAFQRFHDFFRIKGVIAEVNPLEDGSRYADEYLVNLYENGYNEKSTRQIRACTLSPVDCFVPNEEVDVLLTADTAYIFKTNGHLVGKVVCKGPHDEDDFTDNRYWVWVHRISDDGIKELPVLTPHYSEDTTETGIQDIVPVTNFGEANLHSHYVKPGALVYFFRHATQGTKPKYVAISIDENATGEECVASSSGSSSSSSSASDSGSESGSGSSSDTCYTIYSIIWTCGWGWGSWALVSTECLSAPPNGTREGGSGEYPLETLFRKDALLLDGAVYQCRYWYVIPGPGCASNPDCGTNYPGTPSITLPETPEDCACGSEGSSGSSSEGSSSSSSSSGSGSGSSSEGSSSSSSSSGSGSGEWGEIRWNDATKTIEQYNLWTRTWVPKIFFQACGTGRSSA